MKMHYLISTFSVILLIVIFYASSLLAQENSIQEKNQFKNAAKNEVKTMFQNKEQIKLQSKEHGNGFIDLNGDGLNDNAFDSDGDGIPNGKDPDFVKPEDGTGQKNMKGKNIQTKFGGNKYGPGNGTGTGIGPKDGTGNGPGGGSGTGTCDGTGPKGNRGGRNN